MGFLSSLGGPFAGNLGGAINPLSGLGMAGGPMSGLGAMGGAGGGIGSILASLGLGGGGGQKKPQTGPMPPPPASMMPGEMGNVSSPMNPVSQGPGQPMTNFGQAAPHGGMSPGLAQAFQRIGAGLQQQGQAPQDSPLPQAQFQQFDPLQFLSSLGPNNWLGQLGGMR